MASRARTCGQVVYKALKRYPGCEATVVALAAAAKSVALTLNLHSAHTVTHCVSHPWLRVPATHVLRARIRASRCQQQQVHKQSYAQSSESLAPLQPLLHSPVASTVPASFRTLPFLSTDLLRTTVTVSRSFIRPNDRGKDVLSFVVFVDPGGNKEGCKVEEIACGTASGSTHCSRRQQRSERAATDEKKEYRHAFLIVEAKRGPGRNHPRHVLCADSDADRDSWVEMFVRYFSDSYSEEFVSYGQLAFSNSGNNGLLPALSAAHAAGEPACALCVLATGLGPAVDLQDLDLGREYNGKAAMDASMTYTELTVKLHQCPHQHPPPHLRLHPKHQHEPKCKYKCRHKTRPRHSRHTARASSNAHTEEGRRKSQSARRSESESESAAPIPSSSVTPNTAASSTTGGGSGNGNGKPGWGRGGELTGTIITRIMAIGKLKLRAAGGALVLLYLCHCAVHTLLVPALSDNGSHNKFYRAFELGAAHGTYNFEAEKTFSSWLTAYDEQFGLVHE
ncbi:hypothetical protein B0H11DRAFT_1929975 [Mycena galericulata]|nr:hypothetical protein B0H11DRAFT_1929975 [Mycena galericulata]